MAKIINLTDKEVEHLISFEETMEIVEKAFADFQRGYSQAFTVVREEIKKHQGIFGIKSGYLIEDEVLGFKAGGFWLNNFKKGLTNHQSTIVLFDSLTGQLKAILAANYITKVRTAALGAIGCKYLARKDSRILTVIGAGLQGRNQLLASLKVLPDVEVIYIYDVNKEFSKKMIEEMTGKTKKRMKHTDDLEKACRNADIIITATPSYEYIVEGNWIQKGTHISCIGADTRGKQEVDPQIFKNAKIVVDNLEQCITIGECQHAYNQGIIFKQDIYAEIGEIILAEKSGRDSEEEITIFDSTGVVIQDLITAGRVVEKAQVLEKGTKIMI